MSGKTGKMAACVVGERCNGRRRAHWDALPVAEWAAFAPSVSAFFDPASRAKLASVGVDWHSVRCFNLLPPSPAAGEWDAARAAEVASLLDLSPYGLVFAAGARVLAAFGSAARLSARLGLPTFAKHATVVPLPHPSGRCRVWNDRATVSLVRARVIKLLEGEDA